MQEKEPMLLLDTTGSMHYGTGESNATPRYATIHEALALLVERLAAQDSQAEHEEEGGGLRTVTFAGGSAHDLGDLNSKNLATKWASIAWMGGTFIMPGMHLLLQTYRAEFGSRPKAERPALLALVITDGEASDTSAFASLLEQTAGEVYVALAIIGYGAEHDQALAAYTRVAMANPAHVKVLSLAGETNPETICTALLGMIE